MKRENLQVAALESGTVIDHIPSDKVFQAVSLLGLDKMTSPVTIGYNLPSSKMGTKGIIKVADKFFTDEELSRLSVITSHVTLCIIKDYEVVQKRQVDLPDILVNIVKCPNPKCICNNEPMATRFRTVPGSQNLLKCSYCNHEVSLDDIKLL